MPAALQVLEMVAVLPRAQPSLRNIKTLAERRQNTWQMPRIDF
jgi:hypothetical protein